MKAGFATMPQGFQIPCFGQYKDPSATAQYPQPPPFRFQERTMPIDWRSLCKVSIERVLREVDIAALEVRFAP